MKVEALSNQVISTLGDEGLNELMELFPQSVFLWDAYFGFAVIWHPGSDYPESLFLQAGYFEVFGEKAPRKDRTHSGVSLARERYPDLAVVIDVMFS